MLHVAIPRAWFSATGAPVAAILVPFESLFDRSAVWKRKMSYRGLSQNVRPGHCLVKWVHVRHLLWALRVLEDIIWFSVCVVPSYFPFSRVFCHWLSMLYLVPQMTSDVRKLRFRCQTRLSMLFNRVTMLSANSKMRCKKPSFTCSMLTV